MKLLRTAVDAAEVGDKDKLDGFRRLESFVRTADTQLDHEADFDAVIAH